MPVWPMTKTPNSYDLNQVNLADQFAAPNLYRNAVHHKETTHAYKEYPQLKGKPRKEISCISNERVPRAEVLMGLDSIPLYNDQNNPDSTPYVQRAVFYADKIIVHPQYLPTHDRPNPNRGKIDNLTRGRFNGFISRSSGNLIRKRLEAWIKSVYTNRDLKKSRSRPKHTHVGFLTLTLPGKQIHTDNEIKRSCLMPFIQQLKRIYGVEAYFWAAEPQEKGDIHFHLLIDRWVDREKVNDHWNIATDHLGYLSRYVARTGDVRPPSTNIRACPPDMSLVKYVMKYVSKQPEIRMSCYPPGHVRGAGESVRSEWKPSSESRGELGVVVKRSKSNVAKVVSCSYWEKEELKGGMMEAIERGLEVLGDQIESDGIRVFRRYERRPIGGRSWNMSSNLKSVSVHAQYCSERVYDLLSILEWDPSVKIVQGEYHQVYYCNVFNKLMRNDPVLLQDYRNHYISTYQSIYHPPPPELKKTVDPMRIEPPPNEEYKVSVRDQLRIAI